MVMSRDVKMVWVVPADRLDEVGQVIGKKLVPKNPATSPREYFDAAGEWHPRDFWIERRLNEKAITVYDEPPAPVAESQPASDSEAPVTDAPQGASTPSTEQLTKAAQEAQDRFRGRRGSRTLSPVTEEKTDEA